MVARRRRCVLINPKGAGLRKIGLYTTYARGGDHFPATATRATPRAPGVSVELRRDRDNAHDRNAIALATDQGPFAWVQRGRAAAVSRHVDAGEDFAAVCFREGFFLIGARTDLEHMLT